MSALIAARKRQFAEKADVRRDRIVAHLERTGAWINAFGIARVLDLSRVTTARDCAILVQKGRLRQELREAGGGYHSVHYHAG